MPELETIFALVLILLGFGFVIFVHELGHFAVAKAVGIKVTQFAIGFGQALFAYRKGMGFRRGTTEAEYARRITEYLQSKGISPKAKPDQEPEFGQDQIAEASEALGLSETEYRWNWMPLGGYVKMLGQEDMDPTATSPDPRAFNNKPVWARACVISAGVVMNIIFGLVFFTICFLKGVDFPPAIVGAVVPDSPAATASAIDAPEDEQLVGLQPGDKILKLNRREVDDFVGVSVGVALASRDAPVDLKIERDGQPLTFRMVPRPGDQGLLNIGIFPPTSTQLISKRALDRAGSRLDGRLADSGVEPGMKLVRAGTREVERMDQVDRVFARSDGQPVELVFDAPRRDEVVMSVRPVPETRAAGDEVEEARSWLRHWMGLIPVVEVRQVLAGSGAEEAGVRSGDVIASIDGAPFPDQAALVEKVSARAGRTVQIEVIRGEERLVLQSRVGRDGRIGIIQGLATGSNRFATVLDRSPMASLRWEPGSRLVEVDGRPVTTLAEIQEAFVQALAEDGSRSVPVTVELNLGADETTIQTRVEFDEESRSKVLAKGWTAPDWLAMAGFETLRVPLRRDNPISAAILGIEKTHDFMIQVYITIARLFQGTVKPSHMRGPLGIADEGTRIARQGWPYLLFFLGLISVNLAVINFLPIPIVDGGLMVFLLVEKIKGSPVHPRVLNAANIIGLALIVTLFLVVTFHDAVRLFGGR
ncbi:MAG: site-2 protease family protein [Phycisphaeraceae bacterium]|nr:site-2 protease family protein [Phycisphaeraceae bacterium]